MKRCFKFNIDLAASLTSLTVDMNVARFFHDVGFKHVDFKHFEIEISQNRKDKSQKHQSHHHQSHGVMGKNVRSKQFEIVCSQCSDSYFRFPLRSTFGSTSFKVVIFFIRAKNYTILLAQRF